MSRTPSPPVPPLILPEVLSELLLLLLMLLDDDDDASELVIVAELSPVLTPLFESIDKEEDAAILSNSSTKVVLP